MRAQATRQSVGGAILTFFILSCAGAGDSSGDAAVDGGRETTPPTRGEDAGVDAPAVLPGLEVLLQDSIHLVRGRRVGLVTNHTGLSPDGTHTIDRLRDHPDVELVALYSPEHGIRGTAEAGERVASGRDEPTGLPLHSLYGDTRKPTPSMLEGVEVLLFDIQDVGARYYTYVWTMALAQEAAGEAGIPFVVLDRPNPIGGHRMQGNVLEPAFATFVGLHPVPMRHGLTPGELARVVRDAYGVEADLHVVPLQGWRRDMLFPETGLPWVPLSPNMPSVTSALHYPGTCLFEGTNLSVGRGTENAFQWIGAPWLDGEELAARLEALELPGVRFEPVSFTPRDPGDGKYGGEVVSGVRFVATDPDLYDPPVAAVAALLEARRLAGERWEWRPAHFDRLAGNDRLRRMIDEGRPLGEIVAPWRDELAAFHALSEPHLLYR
ncbi:MAG: DUF1343 domain-containing protein [Gemmatimonadetes bacterium]|nr:DUF1343 domain-containing protein [Gemmatimonadota bacterium]